MQPDSGKHRRVGAQHDHLAVRHVDDAHRAVGDGKAERHKQENRADTQAYEDDVEHDTADRSYAG